MEIFDLYVDEHIIIYENQMRKLQKRNRKKTVPYKTTKLLWGKMSNRIRIQKRDTRQKHNNTSGQQSTIQRCNAKEFQNPTIPNKTERVFFLRYQERLRSSPHSTTKIQWQKSHGERRPQTTQRNYIMSPLSYRSSQETEEGGS